MFSTRKPWQHCSPSQISTARRCARKHVLEKRFGLQSPGTKATERGHKMHAELETYLLHGTAPGPLAACGIHRLPTPPQSKDLVERQFAIVDDALPVPLLGSIDLIEPPGVPGAIAKAERITDHKSTSNFKYRREPDELRNDPQAIIYGVATQPHFDNAAIPLGYTITDSRKKVYPAYALTLPSRALNFRHVYYLTTGAPKSAEVEVTLTPDDMISGLLNIAETMLVMSKNMLADHPSEVKPNPDACGDYGGCPFRAHCASFGDVKPFGAFSALFIPTKPKGEVTQMSTSFMDQLKARKTAQPAEAPAEAPAVQGFAAMLAAKRAEAPAAAPVVAPGPINPPDGTPAAAVAEAPAVKKARKSGKVALPDGTPLSSLSKDDAFTARVAFLDQIEAIGGATLTGYLAESVYRKLAKIGKTEIKADIALMLTILEDRAVMPGAPAPAAPAVLPGFSNAPATPPPVAAPTPAVAPVVAAPVAAPGGALYVGCAPRKGSAVYFDEWALPLREALAKDAGLPSWLLLDYDKSRRLLAALIETWIGIGTLTLPPTLVIRRDFPGCGECVAVLAPHYAEIVESF